MFQNLIIFFILCTVHAGEVDVKFDADVLGEHWSYELLKPARSKAVHVKAKYQPESDNDIDHKFINDIADNHGQRAIESPFNIMQTIEAAVKKIKAGEKSTVIMKTTTLDDSFIVKPQVVKLVKDDTQITEFTKHIFKQSLKVFDAIKDKVTDEETKKEVDFLAKNYEEKFGDFVRETQKQKIKTRLGRQKVIMNTLETSNLIMKRLINYLAGVNNEVLRSGPVFQNEINKKIDIENNHICKKFGICRSRYGFTEFLVELITIMLTANDKKIIQARDALAEVMKYSEFSRFMSPETEEHFRKGIADIETYDVFLLKSVLHIVKNLMLHKNKPIEVVGKIDKRVNKTVGALEIVDAFEKALPPNEENLLLWMDLKNSLIEWKDGKRDDIKEITQTFADHLKRGTDKFDEKTTFDIQRNIGIILGF